MKVLLDTSLLLPTLGIEVRGAERLLERLWGHELYYSELSILEAIWVALSLARRGVLDRDLFEWGLQSVFEGYRRAELSPEVVMMGLELYELGHRDIVDCLLYSTALSYGMRFASLDRELREFVRRKGLEDVFLDGG